jgi:hypothetical protein
VKTDVITWQDILTLLTSFPTFMTVHVVRTLVTLVFLQPVFSRLSQKRHLPDRTMNTTAVSYKKYELLTFPKHPGLPPIFWWDPCCSSFWFSVLCFCYVVCLRSGACA